MFLYRLDDESIARLKDNCIHIYICIYIVLCADSVCFITDLNFFKETENSDLE